MINRGGENMAPREVDDVLTGHPAIAQAVTFAVPHATLGEDVAAAVVLRDHATATEQDIRAFALTCMASYKVPSRVVIVEEIPKGPTGKVQRIGLAEQLSSQLQTAFVPPSNPAEEAMAKIWAKVIGCRHVGRHDNFFALGGDSLLAARLMSQVEKRFGKHMPLATLFEAPTVEQLAALVQQENWSAPWTSLVAIQSAGSKPPFFCVHGHGGDVFLFRHLARYLGPNQPFYGLQTQHIVGHHPHHAEVDAMATSYLQEIRTLQPTGSYLLGGFCSGATVAFEMAQKLQRQGEGVALSPFGCLCARVFVSPSYDDALL